MKWEENAKLKALKAMVAKLDDDGKHLMRDKNFIILEEAYNGPLKEKLHELMNNDIYIRDVIKGKKCHSCDIFKGINRKTIVADLRDMLGILDNIEDNDERVGRCNIVQFVNWTLNIKTFTESVRDCFREEYLRWYEDQLSQN